MDLRVARCLGLAAAVTVALYAQSSALEFEVASLKPTADHNIAGMIKRMPGERGYVGTNMPLIAYIRIAYQLRDSQITVADWVKTDNFDLDAKAEKPSTPDELHVMLQHLLEQRFQMKVRHEAREQAGFHLVVDKGGIKMADHDPADRVTLPISPGWGTHVGANVTMPYFAFYLSSELDKTVVDKTGLDGHYDFKADWMPDGAQMTAMPMPVTPGAPPAPTEMRMTLPPMPPLSVALKQLGLRLDPAKVPAEHLVIEHLDKLIEN